MTDTDTTTDQDGYEGPMQLEWRTDPPSPEIIAKVKEDIRVSLWGLDRPEKLITHTVFLSEDPDESHFDGPAVGVWGEEGNPNFVCEYVDKVEWVTLEPEAEESTH